MKIKENKARLVREIEIAKKMLHKNAAEFKPTSYILSRNSHLGKVTSKWFSNPLEMSNNLMPLTQMSWITNIKSGWIAQVVKFILQYYKIESTNKK